MLKVREGDIRLQLQRYLQFVPVNGSRELGGKAAKVSVGFGDDQCNYLLERLLWVSVAMVTSELRYGGALPSKDL
jgi:hypothetical protein